VRAVLWFVTTARPWHRGLWCIVSKYLYRPVAGSAYSPLQDGQRGTEQTKVCRTIGFPSGLGLDRYVKPGVRGVCDPKALHANSQLRATSLRSPTVVVSRLTSRRTRLRSVRNSKDFITRTVMTADVLGRARFVSVSSKPEDMMTAIW
jgi:hypothetical protein